MVSFHQTAKALLFLGSHQSIPVITRGRDGTWRIIDACPVNLGWHMVGTWLSIPSGNRCGHCKGETFGIFNPINEEVCSLSSFLLCFWDSNCLGHTILYLLQWTNGRPLAWCSSGPSCNKETKRWILALLLVLLKPQLHLYQWTK